MPEVSADKIRILDTLRLHSSDVTTCDFDSSFRFASGSSDKKVAVCEWQPGSGFTETIYSPITEYKYGVTKVKFISEEHELITASSDGCIHIMNAEDGDLLHILMHTNLASVRTFCYVPKHKYLISAADDGSICLWDLANNNALIKSLKVHDECVAVACVSVDSKVLLTGDSTGFVKVWNILDLCDTEMTASSLQPCHCIPDCHDLGITQADFSPIFDVSNKGVEYRFISGGNDNLLKVWRLTCFKRGDESLHCTSEVIFTIVGHGSVVTDVKFSADGKMAVSTSLDKTVRLWAINQYGYQCLTVLNGHKRYVTSCAFSLDGTLLATGSNDKSVIIWDLTGSRTKDEHLMNPSSLNSLPPSPFKLKNTSPLLQKIENLGNAINSCAFSKSNLLAAGGTDKLVRLWHSISTTKFVELSVSPLYGHQYAVNQVEFSSCSLYLVSCSVDGTAILWNVTDYTQIGTVHSIEGGIKCCRFSPDSQMLATGGDYETVYVWNVNDLQPKVDLTGHTDAVSCLAFTNDSRYLASGCLGGSVRIWCVAPCITICLLLQENVHDLGLSSMDFCTVDNFFLSKRREYSMATCGNDSLVKLWLLRVVDELTAVMEAKFSLMGHGGDVTCVRFSPTSGRIVASTATDKTARIWDTNTGVCLHVLDSKEAFLTSCAFSFDGQILATGTLDKSVFLWDLRKVMDESENYAATASKYTERLPADGMADCPPHDEVNDLVHQLDISDFGAVPHEFICPITQQLMVHPVVCSDGHTYEQSAIEAWFSSGKFSSPMTNEPLTTTTLTANEDLRDRIALFLDEMKEK